MASSGSWQRKRENEEEEGKWFYCGGPDEINGFVQAYRPQRGVSGGSLVKNLPPSRRHELPGSGRSPGEGNGNPLQYSCLGNSTDSGAWWATVHEAAKNRT